MEASPDTNAQVPPTASTSTPTSPRSPSPTPGSKSPPPSMGRYKTASLGPEPATLQPSRLSRISEAPSAVERGEVEPVSPLARDSYRSSTQDPWPLAPQDIQGDGTAYGEDATSIQVRRVGFSEDLPQDMRREEEGYAPAGIYLDKRLWCAVVTIAALLALILIFLVVAVAGIFSLKHSGEHIVAIPALTSSTEIAPQTIEIIPKTTEVLSTAGAFTRPLTTTTALPARSSPISAADVSVAESPTELSIVIVSSTRAGIIAQGSSALSSTTSYPSTWTDLPTASGELSKKSIPPRPTTRGPGNTEVTGFHDTFDSIIQKPRRRKTTQPVGRALTTDSRAGTGTKISGIAICCCISAAAMGLMLMVML